jgi:ATP-dependent Lhr-like helicase
MNLAIEIPNDELGAVATNEMWRDIHDRLAALIAAHRTTLVFVNTRRLSERVAHHLAERLGERAVLAHHGSLSRELRLVAEDRLKRGDLRAIVATASLELGIDIGTVDLVCQIGSPRVIGVALQRIGRSGHHVDGSAIPKGRLFATTRDELLECAALVRAIRAGELDELKVPLNALDVLAQHIVAATACEDWSEDELFALARRSHPYRTLARRDFDALVAMLSDGIATSRGRSGALVHRDVVNGRLRGRRGARLAAITSGGAIPENANYYVIAEPDGSIVGTLDEDFAVETMAGDVFLLGTSSWRVRRVEAGRVRVEDAHGASPSIPFWRGEAPGRTIELSRELSRVRERSAGEDAVAFLINDCGMDTRSAEQAHQYVREGRDALGALPTDRTVVIERFFDEGGGMQLVVHAPFGARINRAWGLALRKRFCRTFNFELQAAATDNGLVISLGEHQSFPLEAVLGFLNSQTAKDVLVQAMLDSPMFTARWRWNTSRALAVLRFAGGRKVPPPIQRMRADDLMAAVFPDQVACPENLTGPVRIPDHPLVNETIRDCLHEAMDVEGLKGLLDALADGSIRAVVIDTPEPSPFSHELLNANPYAYLDDAPLEERRARAVQMRRSLSAGPDSSSEPAGALDAAAIVQVASDAWPVVRNADELHDALLTLVTVPPQDEWTQFAEELSHARRAATLTVQGGGAFWVAAERLDLARAVHPGATLAPPIAAPASGRHVPDTAEGCAAEIIRGWLECTGPATAATLSKQLTIPLPLIAGGLAQLEAEGQILRGRFTGGLGSREAGVANSAPGASHAELEWCNRRVLARIHRLTLGKLRREIEPVSITDFMRFLLRWQHVAPGTALHGFDGTVQIVRQLQGYDLSAAAWEAEVLPRRLGRYEASLLDRLCLSGDVMWGRLSPHPTFDAELENAERDRRRFRPTRHAPITFFLREDAAWLLAARELRAGNAAVTLSDAAAEVRDRIETRGALFFGELTRMTGRPAIEVEDALWELVAAGLVTADGFENLRALMDPKRRHDGARPLRPRHAAGRWALLQSSRGMPAAVDRPARDIALPRAGGDEAPLTSVDVTSHFARQLLTRWGVVFRDLVARETLCPPWSDVLLALRRMEARGEIRGGRFVAGFLGEQYAVPDALELLRAVRRSEPTGQQFHLSAADPLNLAGIITPGPRVSAFAGTTVTIDDGRLEPALA